MCIRDRGVLAYAADNQSVLPPHPAERINGTFSVANYLNYHQGVAGWAKNEGTYYYLGSYLPLVDTFMCPLGRTRDYAELQYQYENYKDSGEGTNCSYNSVSYTHLDVYKRQMPHQVRISCGK